LFRDSQGIVDFNAEVSDGAFDLGVAQQKLAARRLPVRR
jgi:hypothetical protein